MLSITPTKLGDYLVCPHKYKLKHLERQNEEGNPTALAFGSSMHKALEILHTSKSFALEQPFDASKIEKLLNRCWSQAVYGGAEESDAYFKRGVDALLRYYAAYYEDSRQQTASVAEVTIGTEVYLSFVVRQGDLSVRFGCKVDRVVVVAGNVLELIDYKTGASGRVPTSEFLQTDLPTFLYRVLARLNYEDYERIRVTFINVLSLAKSSVEYAPEQVKINKTALWQIVKRLAVDDLIAVPSEACAWCGYRENCAAVNRAFDFEAIR